MAPRARKLIGGAAMLVFVLAYALVAMALADSRPVQSNGEITKALIYAVLGLAWVLPLMPLIAWMEGGRRKRA